MAEAGTPTHLQDAPEKIREVAAWQLSVLDGLGRAIERHARDHGYEYLRQEGNCFQAVYEGVWDIRERTFGELGVEDTLEREPFLHFVDNTAAWQGYRT